MYAIGVDDNHARGQSGFRDFGAWEIIVPEVYNVFEVGEVDGLEEVTIPTLYPVKVMMEMGVLDAYLA